MGGRNKNKKKPQNKPATTTLSTHTAPPQTVSQILSLNDPDLSKKLAPDLASNEGLTAVLGALQSMNINNNITITQLQPSSEQVTITSYKDVMTELIVCLRSIEIFSEHVRFYLNNKQINNFYHALKSARDTVAYVHDVVNIFNINIGTLEKHKDVTPQNVYNVAHSCNQTLHHLFEYIEKNTPASSITNITVKSHDIGLHIAMGELGIAYTKIQDLSNKIGKVDTVDFQLTELCSFIVSNQCSPEAQKAACAALNRKLELQGEKQVTPENIQSSDKIQVLKEKISEKYQGSHPIAPLLEDLCEIEPLFKQHETWEMKEVINRINILFIDAAKNLRDKKEGSNFYNKQKNLQTALAICELFETHMETIIKDLLKQETGLETIVDKKFLAQIIAVCLEKKEPETDKQSDMPFWQTKWKELQTLKETIQKSLEITKTIIQNQEAKANENQQNLITEEEQRKEQEYLEHQQELAKEEEKLDKQREFLWKERQERLAKLKEQEAKKTSDPKTEVHQQETPLAPHYALYSEGLNLVHTNPQQARKKFEEALGISNDSFMNAMLFSALADSFSSEALAHCKTIQPVATAIHKTVERHISPLKTNNLIKRNLPTYQTAASNIATSLKNACTYYQQALEAIQHSLDMNGLTTNEHVELTLLSNFIGESLIVALGRNKSIQSSIEEAKKWGENKKLQLTAIGKYGPNSGNHTHTQSVERETLLKIATEVEPVINSTSKTFENLKKYNSDIKTHSTGNSKTPPNLQKYGLTPTIPAPLVSSQHFPLLNTDNTHQQKQWEPEHRRAWSFGECKPSEATKWIHRQDPVNEEKTRFVITK